jgi:RNA-binding protein NOB1
LHDEEEGNGDEGEFDGEKEDEEVGGKKGESAGETEENEGENEGDEEDDEGDEEDDEEEDGEDEDDEDEDEDDEDEDEEEDFSYSTDDFPVLSGNAPSVAKEVSESTHSWAAIAKSPSSATRKMTKNDGIESRPNAWIMPPKPTSLESSSRGTLHLAEKMPLSHTQSMLSRILGGGGNENAASSSRMEEEDDGLGWVGPQNLATARARETDLGGSKLKGAQLSSIKESRKVACVTTDFSMQNMAMQMGLGVISVDGILILSIKQWVLRCMACRQIHYDMTRLFCKRCGANHLSRVSCSIDSNTGELRLHLKKNYHVEKRGTKYSLPKPGQQGRFSGELLLREDQLLQGIWKQKVVKIRKDVRSAFGEDVTSEVGIHVNKSQHIQVGLGKENPNARKGRERRGKAKRKSEK